MNSCSKDDEKIFYRGVSIEELSKEQLLEALKCTYRLYLSERKIQKEVLELLGGVFEKGVEVKQK